MSSSTVAGWPYDSYRNPTYPYSISGDQTFVVGTRVGSSASTTSPLWVWLHGGGWATSTRRARPSPTAPP